METKKVFIYFVYLLSIISYPVYGQILKGSEWIRIKSERKDGSRIIDRSRRLLIEPIKFSFDESLLTVSYDGESKYNYIIANKTLSIGRLLNGEFTTLEEFQIDTVNGVFLVISQIKKEKLPDDKLNTYTFIKSRYYLQYLISNNKISISNDSIIECNKFLFPYYKGNIDIELTKELLPFKNNGLISGYMIFTTGGKISHIDINKAIGLPNDEVNKFREVLFNTEGKWKFPLPDKNFNYKLYFTSNYYWPGKIDEHLLSKVSIIYNPEDTTNFVPFPLPNNQFQKVDQYFKKGIRLLRQSKYQNAINEFQKCLDIDSLHVDSYYNKAYAHYKMNEIQLACEVWKRLMILGQKQGEMLFEENCK